MNGSEPSNPLDDARVGSGFRQTLNHLSNIDPHVERRNDARTPRSVSLEIQPLNMDFQPDGESFYALSRDVSSNGLGFVNSDPLSHEYIRIGMPEQTEATIIAKVRYNLSVGVGYPLFLVGVSFES